MRLSGRSNAEIPPKKGSRESKSTECSDYSSFPTKLEGPRDYVDSNAASFMTVFQLRVVPRLPNTRSIRGVVRRDLPIPTG